MMIVSNTETGGNWNFGGESVEDGEKQLAYQLIWMTNLV
jgi:hypothetical protein